MALKSIDHVNIDTTRPEETIAFYTEVLGLENRPEDRPDFGSPGAWLFLGDHPVVHLNFLEPSGDGESALGSTGSFNHVAFAGSGFVETCALLDARDIEYRTVDMPTFKQIFVRDPNGVAVEINIRGNS